jgi:hypothetical protein
MKRLLSILLSCCMLILAGCQKNVQVRFDSVYFFQTEEDLQKKKINLEQLSQYTRTLQTQVAKVMQKGQTTPGNGYIVVAVRSDQEVAVWLDMEPVLHEYYDYEIVEAIRKMRPFDVDSGIVVFGIKMAIDTPKHTDKAIPEPKDWIGAKKKVGDPNDVEQIAMSIWPEE